MKEKICENCYHSVMTIKKDKNGERVKELKCGYEEPETKLKKLKKIPDSNTCSAWEVD